MSTPPPGYQPGSYQPGPYPPPYGQVPPTAPPKRKKRGRTVLIVLGVIVALGVISRLGGGSDTASPTVASGTSTSSAGSATSASSDSGAQAAAGIGTEVRDGDFAFVVTKVEPGVKTLGKGAWSTQAQGEFVLVRVTVTNVGTESTMFSGGNQKLLDSQGREFDADSGSAVMYVPDSESFLNQINPGNTVQATIVFDVPVGLQPAAIELHDSMFSGGALVSLR
ncbi:DUF4352 domain-containing protein [Pseudonocardia lutea]|uniref:DUF4352 domain-containing protein n=1 Tax=Pseudonocardia lutea TaxID=2172015 RepID=A0ABW1I3P3_9PSEU